MFSLNEKSGKPVFRPLDYPENTSRKSPCDFRFMYNGSSLTVRENGMDMGLVSLHKLFLN